MNINTSFLSNHKAIIFLVILMFWRLVFYTWKSVNKHNRSKTTKSLFYKVMYIKKKSFCSVSMMLMLEADNRLFKSHLKENPIKNLFALLPGPSIVIRSKNFTIYFPIRNHSHDCVKSIKSKLIAIISLGTCYL